LTVSGISLALGSIVLLSGITQGFIMEFNRLMTGTDVDLVARQKDATDTAYSAISEKIGRQIAALPGVKSVSGIVFSALTADNLPFLLIFGYAPHEQAIQHFAIVEGRGLAGNREVILGSKTREALKVNVGEVVRFGQIGFRVVGVYETGVSYEETAAVVSLRDGQELTGKPRQVSMYAIKVDDPGQAEAIQKQLEAAIPEIMVAMSSEFAESLPDMKTMDAMMVGIAVLAVIVGGIGMMNTMIMSVYERTREIGTLRAVGWQRRHVIALILKESVVLSLLSLILGFIGAIVSGWLLGSIPLWGDFMKVVISPGLVLQTLFIAVLLGAIGGIYPAWRAATLSPVEALRYE
jgi:ABC-type antimicrobial peptide transport system permease subunit